VRDALRLGAMARALAMRLVAEGIAVRGAIGSAVGQKK
jgi:hypothetical protein